MRALQLLGAVVVFALFLTTLAVSYALLVLRAFLTGDTR